MFISPTASMQGRYVSLVEREIQTEREYYSDLPQTGSWLRSEKLPSLTLMPVCVFVCVCVCVC